MDLKWEEDEHGDWTLKIDDIEVQYLTDQQKNDLKEIFEKIKVSDS